MAAIANSCFWLVDFYKSSSLKRLAKWTETWWETPMEGYIKFPDFFKSVSQKQELPVVAMFVNESKQNV
jgi:hypothetical protein